MDASSRTVQITEEDSEPKSRTWSRRRIDIQIETQLDRRRRLRCSSSASPCPVLVNFDPPAETQPDWIAEDGVGLERGRGGGGVHGWWKWLVGEEDTERESRRFGPEEPNGTLPVGKFCKSLDSSGVLVNGMVCKDPKLAQATDFFFSGLHVAGNTSNAVGSKVSPVNVAQIPGLNTLGISMVRIDYAPWGINPPHTHPRATEILTVLEGSLHVGFVTSNQENRLIAKVLNKGDVFVFSEGLVHFQQNVGHGHAVAIAALGSQNPGVITIANAVFGSKPDISGDVLTKAFQVDKNIIHQLHSKF
ncbi:putative germin-like protein 2-1 [Cornus florida]|uniref:putative germin-like protein 2-1 n=1 Tax=Cornus florida TaxID=4283 RepID=UPI00289C281A|nr:putative germin-like protein 2-1 [Cornus florida]